MFTLVPGVTDRSPRGSSTYVPEFTSPGTGSAGFSRNSRTRCSGSTETSPYGRASSTAPSEMVATAPRA